VYNINVQEGAFLEARTSYFHHSVGGYHGVKLRRYQDLYDSCLFNQTNELIRNIQAGKMDFNSYGVINMLNIKYMVYGPQRDNIIPNAAANGNAWFVREVIKVNSATEELEKVCGVNTRQTAVVNESEAAVEPFTFDSTSSITLLEHSPNRMKYESQSNTKGFAVFSEIYYPKGWIATIDGKEVNILRANYVLRALNIPEGKHTIEFKFLPGAYVTGNKITSVSSWLMLIAFFGSIGWTFKKEK